MPEITEGAGHATFINVFRTDPRNQARVLGILAELADRVAAAAPGFVSASAHASHDGTHVFNYLQWRTADDLAAMQASAPFRALAAGFDGLLDGFEQYPCRVVHVREARHDRTA